MSVIVVIAVVWLFLLVLALAILRTAGQAERAAEEQHRRDERADRPARERGRHSHTVTSAVIAVALPFAGGAVVVADADAQACRGARSAPGASAPSVTLCLINTQRRAHGLSPVGADARLARAAQRHARDMVARAYFSHYSPAGTSFADRLRRAGYPRGCGWSGGETLAWGTGALATPASRVRAWMRSPQHRAILLDPGFRDAGLGVVTGSPGDASAGATYVGEFGRRRC